jgi:protein O-mannosyl-transferase
MSLQCYKRILQLDPINIQGLHNLCVVYVEHGKLAQAQSCLSHAHRLAPHEEYILKHLQIVQTRIQKLKSIPGESKEKEIAFAEFDPKEYGGDVIVTPPQEQQQPQQAAQSDANSSVNSNKNNRNNNSNNNKKSNDNDSQSKKQKTINSNKKTRRPPQSQLDDPMFVESNTMKSKIEDDYRSSNSGQTNVNRNKYQDHPHPQHNVHHYSNQQHHQQQQQTRSIKSTTKNNNKYTSSHQVANDLEDRSTGMS